MYQVVVLVLLADGSVLFVKLGLDSVDRIELLIVMPVKILISDLLHEAERVLAFQLVILFYSHVAKHPFDLLTHYLVHNCLIVAHQRLRLHFELQLVFQFP